MSVAVSSAGTASSVFSKALAHGIGGVSISDASSVGVNAVGELSGIANGTARPEIIATSAASGFASINGLLDLSFSVAISSTGTTISKIEVAIADLGRSISSRNASRVGISTVE